MNTGAAGGEKAVEAPGVSLMIAQTARTPPESTNWSRTVPHVNKPRGQVGNLLGAAQAEADTPMLSRAFVETGDYQALRFTSDFSYVVGRRGTGKSALFARLKEHFEDDVSVLLLTECPQDYEMIELQQLLLSISAESLVSDTFHSNINWLSSRVMFGFSSMSENS
jgi:hypothetical protein